MPSLCKRCGRSMLDWCPECNGEAQRHREETQKLRTLRDEVIRLVGNVVCTCDLEVGCLCESCHLMTLARACKREEIETTGKEGTDHEGT